jgi:hypothetical protein
MQPLRAKGRLPALIPTDAWISGKVSSALAATKARLLAASGEKTHFPMNPGRNHCKRVERSEVFAAREDRIPFDGILDAGLPIARSTLILRVLLN